MNEWSKLPNAEHIDWVIQSLKDNPDTWVKAWDEAFGAAWAAASDAAWAAASYAAGDSAKEAAWAAASYAARAAASYAAWAAASYAALDAILALVAYDNCEKYLKMSYDQLLMWSELDPHPAGVLLLPYLFVKEKTKSKEIENV